MSVTAEQYSYYMAHSDDDRRPNEIAAGVCGFLLATIALTARITSRRVSRARFGLDDWMVCVGMLGVLAYSIGIYISVWNGEGLHIIFVKNEKIFIQVMVCAIVFYAWAVMFTKVSILLYYRRIFSKVVWLNWASMIMGAIVIAYNVALIFVAAFQCVPLSSLWTGKPGTCIDTTPPYVALAIINVITDVAILALPIYPVLKLNMKMKRKIQVLGIFLTGGVTSVCVFGIVRCDALSTMATEDPSWNDCFSGIWSFVEASVGIVAACLPTLGPLFKGANFSLTSRGSSGRYFSAGRRLFSRNRDTFRSNSSAKSLGSSSNGSEEHVRQETDMRVSNISSLTGGYDAEKMDDGLPPSPLPVHMEDRESSHHPEHIV
ncbi:hypothetical protein N7456_000960 [Penicillium angulare]|uniref:Rhodopsin domain-containing protein n=1 Tax=Penicillium angulare TaxID=116970 RepID=A0A9W9KRE5_9EURO|nr:hypothetical protein N7456_000960 [Penicillium angulare]